MRLRGKMNTLLLPNKMIMWNNFFVNNYVQFTEGCYLKSPQGDCLVYRANTQNVTNFHYQLS